MMCLRVVHMDARAAEVFWVRFYLERTPEEQARLDAFVAALETSA